MQTFSVLDVPTFSPAFLPCGTGPPKSPQAALFGFRPPLNLAVYRAAFVFSILCAAFVSIRMENISLFPFLQRVFLLLLHVSSALFPFSWFSRNEVSPHWRETTPTRLGSVPLLKGFYRKITLVVVPSLWPSCFGGVVALNLSWYPGFSLYAVFEVNRSPCSCIFFTPPNADMPFFVFLHGVTFLNMYWIKSEEKRFLPYRSFQVPTERTSYSTFIVVLVFLSGNYNLSCWKITPPPHPPTPPPHPPPTQHPPGPPPPPPPPPPPAPAPKPTHNNSPPPPPPPPPLPPPPPPRPPTPPTPPPPHADPPTPPPPPPPPPPALTEFTFPVAAFFPSSSPS